MKPFPGTIEKRGCKKFLNDEQKAWLAKWFPITENCRLIKAMGISFGKLYDFAAEQNIVKSEAGLKAIMRRSRKAAAKTNEKNGCYDRKRGHPVSAATIEGIHRRWQRERDGITENAQLRIKREDPKKYKEWIEKRSIERRESIRKEKLRVLYGLERKTNLKAVVLTPYKRSQTHHRCNA